MEHIPIPFIPFLPGVVWLVKSMCVRGVTCGVCTAGDVAAAEEGAHTELAVYTSSMGLGELPHRGFCHGS